MESDELKMYEVEMIQRQEAANKAQEKADAASNAARVATNNYISVLEKLVKQ